MKLLMVFLRAADAGEQHRARLVVPDLAASAESEQAGQAGRAGRVDVDAGRRAASSFASSSASLDRRPPVRRRWRACRAPPPASRRSRRRGSRSPRCAARLPRPHEGDRCRAIQSSSASGRARRDRAACPRPSDRSASGSAEPLEEMDDKVVGARQRMRVARLHGVDAGHDSIAPSACASPSAWMTDEASAPPPTWTKRWSRRPPARAQLVAIS
jgi:hypothetical protein